LLPLLPLLPLLIWPLPYLPTPRVTSTEVKRNGEIPAVVFAVAVVLKITTTLLVI
jgi:hypothetical protein